MSRACSAVWKPHRPGLQALSRIRAVSGQDSVHHVRRFLPCLTRSVTNGDGMLARARIRVGLLAATAPSAAVSVLPPPAVAAQPAGLETSQAVPTGDPCDGFLPADHDFLPSYSIWVNENCDDEFSQTCYEAYQVAAAATQEARPEVVKPCLYRMAGETVLCKYEKEKAIGGGYRVVATSDKIADPGRCITEVGKYLPDMHDHRRHFLHLKEDETGKCDDREVFVHLEEGVVKCPSQECARLEENRNKPKLQRSCEARVRASRALFHHYEDRGNSGWVMAYRGKYPLEYLKRGTCVLAFGETKSGGFQDHWDYELGRTGYAWAGILGEQKSFL
ncbi:hypothetical protein C9F11_44200 (plasmid) [Streptomyces sp. YIM 121038]|nr:hypothetical protein C9F11_44200 [Streptomyces sp. YIM 121038]